jgi:hypothetical protein
MNKRSSLSRIDEQVFITMGALCLLCLVILGFRYAARTTCPPVQIIMNDGSALVNRAVTVRAEAKEAAAFLWDMGDGSSNETSAIVAHTYKQPGRYTIKLLVNGACEAFRDVVVTEAPEAVTTYHMPTFICRDTAYVNKPITFEDTSSNASSWEWHFEEGGEPGENRKKVQHTYYYAGKKMVTLKLNGRSDLITYRYIDVIDPAAQQQKTDAAPKEKAARQRPEQKVILIDRNPVVPPITPVDQHSGGDKPAEPPKLKAKTADVTTDELGRLLKGINEGNNQESDITGFFCSSNMSVVYEGKMMLFSAACAELKKIKKSRIKKIEVSCSKDAETNCINGMQINVKKRLLPGF